MDRRQYRGKKAFPTQYYFNVLNIFPSVKNVPLLYVTVYGDLGYKAAKVMADN